MISAKIKNNNTFLIDRLQNHFMQIATPPTNCIQKTITFTYYHFIEAIIQLINQFAKSKTNVSFNTFITDYYVKKYEKNSQLYRYFFSLTRSWKKYIDSQQDPKLFLSLLTQQRNNRQMIKKFIKIRKIILKTINTKILQQISITHSDSITICHMLFHGDSKNKIVKKLNTLFISLKRKFINTASVNGAVACQFFISATEQISNQNFIHLKFNVQNCKQNIKNNEKSIKNSNQLSFNEQFANNYQQKNSQQPQQLSSSYNNQIISELQQKQWNLTKKILNFEQAKNELTNLQIKNKAIDAKLQNFGLKKFKLYPQGWDQFIRNNKIQKQKLLNSRK